MVTHRQEYLDYALNRLRRKVNGRNKLTIRAAYSYLRGALPGISNNWTDEQLLAILEAADDMKLIRLHGIPVYVLVLQIPEEDSEWIGMTIC